MISAAAEISWAYFWSAGTLPLADEICFVGEGSRGEIRVKPGMFDIGAVFVDLNLQSILLQHCKNLIKGLCSGDGMIGDLGQEPELWFPG